MTFLQCIRVSYRASLVAQMVRSLPAMRETWVQSLRQEDTLEKEISIHSSIVAWKIPWTEEPCRLQSMGSQSRTRLSNFTYRPSNRQAQCASRFKETLGSGGRVEALGLLMWSAPDFQKCLGS